jgi:PAS domain S-box-containing protein
MAGVAVTTPRLEKLTYSAPYMEATLAFIEEFNSAAERIFGYKATDVLGQNVKMLMPVYLQSNRARHLFNGSYQCRHIHGPYIWRNRPGADHQ